eukprot:CAMPEP_0113966658 /NCGR_PEP_ID=MMETSP0011_2-20120614/8445_1 /TAXON_ID=101924 /ORGANISM="Rhodosorus marinus" /LENGTH=530 /DNA_ID=CAMNT_0000979351 /DNA_START=21 /DNA_END=1613 /DNA_ORIENTATION=- /assembly_acc=CAM_ASM_000156
MSIRLAVGTIPDYAWDWLNFKEDLYSRFNLESLKLAMVLKGRSKVVDADNISLGSVGEGNLLPQLSRVYEQCKDEIHGNNAFEDTFAMLSFPTLVTEKGILGVQTGGLMACLARSLGMEIKEERFYVEFSEVSSHTLVSCKTASGHVIIGENIMEALCDNEPFNAIAYHEDNPYQICKPATTQEFLTCEICGVAGRRCPCKASELSLTSNVISSMPKNWFESPQDRWFDYRVGSFAVLNDLSTLAVFKSNPEASQLNAAPWTMFSYMKYNMVTDQSTVDNVVMDYLTDFVAAHSPFKEPAVSDGRFSEEESFPSDSSLIEVGQTQSRGNPFATFGASQVGGMNKPVLVPFGNLVIGPGEFITDETSEVSDETGLELLDQTVPAEPQVSSRGSTTHHTQAPPRPECHICGATFSRKYEVNRHIKIVHRAVKDHVCHICNRAFALRQHLNSHIDAVHEKKRDCICKICGMGFPTEAKVNRHVRCVHLKERAYKCQICHKDYFQQSDLLRHMKRKHNPPVSDPIFESNSHIVV